MAVLSQQLAVTRGQVREARRKEEDSLCQVGIEQIEVDGYPEIWFSGSVKTTLEIPDALYREVKVTAARTGKTVTAIVQSALKRELTANTNQPDAQTEKPWTKWAGCLSEIPKEEHKKIRLRIEETFSEIDKEMWQ